MKMDFNRSWLSYTTPEPEEWHLPRKTRMVDLPHDDNIRFDTDSGNLSGPAGAYYPGCSVEYEKTLVVPPQWMDKRVSLIFDGVCHHAVVRANRQFVTRNDYGYTAFQCDLTPFLHEGENLLRVSAINKDVPNSRWYTGTGIYRSVEIWVQDAVMIPWRGVALTTEMKGNNAIAHAKVKITNTSAKSAQRQIRIELMDDEGKTAASFETAVQVEAGEEREIAAALEVKNARLWSDETPYLYRAVVTLLEEGKITDEYAFPYGFRTIAFSAEKGFLLNGKETKLRGGCIHHDNGILGTASYDKAEEHRVKALKASGFNAIRSAHNPASEALLRACDKFGMLVMDEAFDMWREPKMPYDNSMLFEYTWRRDVAAMVERDRNHACVIMYCTGNEIPERDGHSDGARISRELAEYIRALDPTRPVTNALCNVAPEGGVDGLEANLLKERGTDYFAWKTAEFSAPLDVVGYNYMPDRFEPDHERFPERVFCAAETVTCDILNGWDKVERLPYLIGDFVWTAMDYIGEVGVGRSVVDEPAYGLAHYPYRLSGCGNLDIACRKKPSSYYRDCVWERAKRPFIAVESPEIYDKKKNLMWWGWPIVHEYWNYPGQEGKPTRVFVYSRADEVELLLNGRSIGRQPAGKLSKYTASFEIPYESGELTAVGLRDGKETNRHAIRTPGSVRVLSLKPDKQTMNSQEDDLLFVDVELTDSMGNPVIDEERTVYAAVQGSAYFLAAGNTAIKTTANYTDPCQKLHLGHVQIVLRTNGQPGEAVLTCVSEGIPTAALRIRVN